MTTPTPSPLKKTTVRINGDGTVTLTHTPTGHTITGAPIAILDKWGGKIMASYNRQVAKAAKAIAEKVHEAAAMFALLPEPPAVDVTAPIIAAQLGLPVDVVTAVLTPTETDTDEDADDVVTAETPEADAALTTPETPEAEEGAVE